VASAVLSLAAANSSSKEEVLIITSPASSKPSIKPGNFSANSSTAV